MNDQEIFVSVSKSIELRDVSVADRITKPINFIKSELTTTRNTKVKIVNVPKLPRNLFYLTSFIIYISFSLHFFFDCLLDNYNTRLKVT